MKEKAFTLIEVMVVMAIISILAGMMMPPVWKFWESEEIATTRQRMKDLKVAMVGDRTLVQNGVRTHYGFVGDFGELPFGNHTSCDLSFLNSKESLTGSTRYDPDNWSARYLPSSADFSNYATDAWGNPIKCVIVLNTDLSDNRFSSAILRSIAPSGEILEETISESDVIPTNQITGNVFGTISATSSIKVRFTPVHTGIFETMSTCSKLTETSKYETTMLRRLPIGRLNVDLVFSNNTQDCSIKSKANSFSYFVQDNQQLLKMPDMFIP